MNIFYVSTWRHDDLKIFVAEVEKETAKTYVVLRPSWGKEIVKKGNMKGYNALYATTYDEAVSKAINYANESIEICNKNIKYNEREKLRLEQIKAKIQGGKM